MFHPVLLRCAMAGGTAISRASLRHIVLLVCPQIAVWAAGGGGGHIPEYLSVASKFSILRFLRNFQRNLGRRQAWWRKVLTEHGNAGKRDLLVEHWALEEWGIQPTGYAGFRLPSPAYNDSQTARADLSPMGGALPPRQA